MPKKSTQLKYYEAIGRRKSAVARVRLYLAPKTSATSKVAKGEIVINEVPAETYFPFVAFKQLYTLPLQLTDAVGRFAISITARGGGKRGQIDAVRLGISRALEIADGDNRAKLKVQGLLSRDERVRERRKPGTGGKARRQKQSPKR